MLAAQKQNQNEIGLLISKTNSKFQETCHTNTYHDYIDS